MKHQRSHRKTMSFLRGFCCWGVKEIQRKKSRLTWFPKSSDMRNWSGKKKDNINNAQLVAWELWACWVPNLFHPRGYRSEKKNTGQAIAEAIRHAGITPLDVDAMECASLVERKRWECCIDVVGGGCDCGVGVVWMQGVFVLMLMFVYVCKIPSRQ